MVFNVISSALFALVAVFFVDGNGNGHNEVMEHVLANTDVQVSTCCHKPTTYTTNSNGHIHTDVKAETFHVLVSLPCGTVYTTVNDPQKAKIDVSDAMCKVFLPTVKKR